MAKIMCEVPANRGEKIVFEALGRQLDDTWLMTSSYRYVELPGQKFLDREIDLLLAHPRYGLVLIEVKGGQLKRDAEKGWLQYERDTGAYQPTKAFRQIHDAKRGLEKFFKRHGLLKGKFLPIALYVVFAEIQRPREKSAPSEDPLLVFGSEVDSLLQRIQSDLGQKSEDIFDMKNIEKVLFPSITPKPYKPPVANVVDISGLEASVSEIKEKVNSIKEGASREAIALEIDKIRSDIKEITKTATPSTASNKNEITKIQEQLQRLAKHLTRIEANQSSVSNAVANPPEGLEELKTDISQIKIAIEAFSTRVGEERKVEIERVEVDLTSVEQQLGDLHGLVESLKSQPESAEQQQKLTSVLSSIGVLTARMTQLSQVVTANILPAEKFDAKLDRLAELYRDVTNRLEHMFKEQRPDMALVDELRREMRSMHDRLSEMSQRPLPAPILVSPDGSVVVKSRLTPGLVAATIVAVLSLGIAATAALKGNGSDVSSAVTTQLSTVQTTASPTTIAQVTTTSILATSTTSASTTSSTIAADEDVSVAGGAALSPATESTIKRSQVGGVITQPSKPVTTVSVPSVRTTTIPTAPPTTVAALTNIAVSEVALGGKHTCVLSTAGSVFCWGSNDAGQLGQSSFTGSFSSTALKVEGLNSRIKKIVAGKFHTCALDTAGSAFCWGSNGTGQIGNDSTARSIGGYSAVPTPVEVAGGIRFSSISAGASSTCGLSLDMTAYCWGRNADNELGSDGGYSSAVPVTVSGGWTFEQVATGEKALSCGIEESGRILCWGEGDDYYGPDEVTLFNSTYSGAVFGVGSDHMCAISNGRDLRCYSNYSNNVTGVGSSSNNTSGRSKGTLPEPLVSLSLGYHETCGLTADGRAYCWGNFPTLVNTTQTFTSLDLFGARKCGVTKQASLYCWGTDADGRSNSGLVTTTPAAVTVKARA
jgi:alpha-tubulin suppressor-like RCC1 family protein/flagellar biosynthesis chaperone FliJ